MSSPPVPRQEMAPLTRILFFPGQVRKSTGGWVTLGQDQDEVGGGYQSLQSYMGQLARLRLWGRLLSAEEISDVAACDSTPDTDAVLTWPGKEEWQLNHTVKVLEVPRLDICSKKGPYYVFVSPRMPLLSARRLCIAMGSDIAVPSSAQETSNILTLAKVVESDCPGAINEPFLWLGATDEVQEGQWVDDQGRLLTYTNWHSSQPNGGSSENFLVMMRSGLWQDLEVFTSVCCAACKTNDGRPLLVRVRGLCPGFPHDLRYIHDGYNLSKPAFRGFTNSRISWDGDRWRLSHPSR